MRVAVTGGAGRLGRSVVEGLRAAGHEVTSIDRHPHPEAEQSQVAADLTEPGRAARVFSELRPQAVVHLAAIAVPYSAPERTIFEVNTSMGFAVMEAAAGAGVEHVLVASSPTVLGYGRAGWCPGWLPMDERTPVAPFHSYALSKVVLEQMTATFARGNPQMRLASFRPCYVLAPEEWAGALTQQGHTVEERLADPGLAAVSLFNYLDARDAADFVNTWLTRGDSPSGACYFVSAADAMSVRPPAELLEGYLPEIADLAEQLAGHDSLFSIDAARRDLGWEPRRSWRNQMPADALQRVGVSPATEPATTAERTSTV